MSTEEQLETRGSEGLSLVLPAYNEVQNIGPMLESVRGALEGLCRPWEILIVDDGSKDGTAELVEKLAGQDSQVVLIRHRENRGYGAALRSGFERARNELVFFTDADRQFELMQLPLLLEKIDDCHLVAGFRAPRNDPWHRKLLGRLWTEGLNQFYGVGLRDVNCAFKLIRRDALECLNLQSSGAFINAEIVIGLRAHGFRIEECPVGHRSRTRGKQTGASLKVISKALREALEFRVPYPSSVSDAGPRN